MTEETLTAEEIQKRYDSAMDSVNLLDAGQPANMDNDEWADCKQRNIDHLQIMVDKDDWNGQDISVFQTCIDANS